MRCLCLILRCSPGEQFPFSAIGPGKIPAPVVFKVGIPGTTAKNGRTEASSEHNTFCVDHTIISQRVDIVYLTLAKAVVSIVDRIEFAAFPGLKLIFDQSNSFIHIFSGVDFRGTVINGCRPEADHRKDKDDCKDYRCNDR